AALQMGVAALDRAGQVEIVHPAAEGTREQPIAEPAAEGDAAEERQKTDGAGQGEELVERDFDGEGQENRRRESREDARDGETAEAGADPVQDVPDVSSFTHPT